MDTVEALSDPSNPAFRLFSDWRGAEDNESNQRPRLTIPKPLQRQRRLEPDAVAELVAGWEDGASQKELIDRYRISRSALMEHLRRAGVPKRRPFLKPEQVTEAAQFYASGWSLARIGQRLLVAPHTVATALRDAGVTIRPRRGWH